MLYHLNIYIYIYIFIRMYIYIYVRRDRDIPGKIQIQALSRQAVPNSLRKLRQGSGSLREPCEVLHDRILEIRWMVAKSCTS